MNDHRSTREAWGSKIGFVLAGTGSAIGLGNIWRFPTVTGQNGGAAFVLIYLLCILLIGVPVMIAELTIGRKAKSDPVGAFEFLAPGTAWKLVGALGVFTGLMILSFYSVVAGWTLKYIWLTFDGVFVGVDTEQVRTTFTGFISDGPAVVFFHLLFMTITTLIVMGGIQGGIEKASKIMMPVLLGLMVLLVLRSVTLPGAEAGLAFYLKPDFGKVDFQMVMAALGQAFFPLSLGMGAMITYGSYLSKKEDLISSAVYVSLSDTMIAFIAGFAIFPALFSVSGLAPDVGPSLIFVVLPNIFNTIPFGQLFGVGFFVLMSIAAFTSSISLLEVVVAYFIDQRGWMRKKAAFAIGTVAFLLGIPSALSNGAIEMFSGFLDLINVYFGEVSLVIGALFICLFSGWKWGIHNPLAEIRQSNPSFRLAAWWIFLIRYACPVAIVTILVNLLLTHL